MNGFIYYRGPSQITSDPIIGICTLESDNPKTGNMAQTWILHDAIHPVEAVQSGKDKAICGDCTARDVCYVTVGFAPAQVWKKRNDYADLRRAPRKMRDAVAGKKIRLGWRPSKHLKMQTLRSLWDGGAFVSKASMTVS